MVGILLLHFAKASDRVDHRILLGKLSRHGAPNLIIEWITAFLCDRKRRVKLGQVESEWGGCGVNAGMPQGTLLGPGSFLFHINYLESSCGTIKQEDNCTERESCSAIGVGSKLQTAANEASAWCLLQIPGYWTVTKQRNCGCALQKSPLSSVSQWPTTRRSRQCRLHTTWVVFSDDLKWQAHVAHTTSKATKSIYFLSLLKRAAVDPKSLVRVYSALVNPVVEHACHGIGLTKDQRNSWRASSEGPWILILYSRIPPTVKHCGLVGLATLLERGENACRTFSQAMQKTDHKLHHYLLAVRERAYDTRLSRTYCNTRRFEMTLIPYAIRKWGWQKDWLLWNGFFFCSQLHLLVSPIN